MHVIIVDPNNTLRKEALIKLFLQIKDVDTYNLYLNEDLKKIVKHLSLDLNKIAKVEDDIKFILCVCHIGNYEDLEADVIKKHLSETTSFIWYGGKSGDDPRLDSVDAKYGRDKIWKAISSSSLIGEEDAQDLINYAQEKAEGKNPTNPRCLLPPQHLTFLTSLAILCQGYLAAHWDKIENIDELLPGWSSLSDDVKNKPKTNWDRVKKDWWKPALGENMKGEELIKELKAFNKYDEFIKLNKDDVIQCLTKYTNDNLTELVIDINNFFKDTILPSK